MYITIIKSNNQKAKRQLISVMAIGSSTSLHNVIIIIIFSASSSFSPLSFMSTLIQFFTSYLAYLFLYAPLFLSPMSYLLVHFLLFLAHTQTISNVPLILSKMSATPHLLRISLFLIMSLLLVPSIHCSVRITYSAVVVVVTAPYCQQRMCVGPYSSC